MSFHSSPSALFWSISPTFYKRLFCRFHFAKKITNTNCKNRKSAQNNFCMKKLLDNVCEIDSLRLYLGLMFFLTQEELHGSKHKHFGCLWCRSGPLSASGINFAILISLNFYGLFTFWSKYF